MPPAANKMATGDVRMWQARPKTDRHQYGALDFLLRMQPMYELCTFSAGPTLARVRGNLVSCDNVGIQSPRAFHASQWTLETRTKTHTDRHRTNALRHGHGRCNNPTHLPSAGPCCRWCEATELFTGYAPRSWLAAFHACRFSRSCQTSSLRRSVPR